MMFMNHAYENDEWWLAFITCTNTSYCERKKTNMFINYIVIKHIHNLTKRFNNRKTTTNDYSPLFQILRAQRPAKGELAPTSNNKTIF